MVTPWILNISKEIVEAFIYTNSSLRIMAYREERFGGCNGPLLYQLQREVASISQENMSMVGYFTKLGRLSNGLMCLIPVPQCSCGSAKVVTNMTSLNQLMQLLTGLNDSYDHIKIKLDPRSFTYY